MYHHQHFKVCFEHNLLPSSAVGLVWESSRGGQVVESPLQSMNMLSTASSMYGGCGKEYRGLQSNQKYFPLPFLHIWYLPCAASSEGAEWTYVWVEVFLLQAWDGSKLKIILASHPSWTRNWMLSHLLFGNKINKQQFSLARLERGRENVENSSETMS